MAQASSSGVLDLQEALVGWERVSCTQSSRGHLAWSGGYPLAVAASGSLEGEGQWRSPSLQRELKIARRDDVIRFPQLSTPPQSHTYTHILTDTDTHTHKGGYTHS